MIEFTTPFAMLAHVWVGAVAFHAVVHLIVFFMRGTFLMEWAGGGKGKK